jgi:geranylgeranyl diphosphate synthase, type I
MTDHARLAQRAAPSAPETLARCRGMVLPALRKAVDRLHPRLAHMAAFAFGWRDLEGAPLADGDGGKGLRPALTLLCAEAVGACAEDAIAGAVAVEMVHAFSLVHDDLMDGDERRRHRPTLWKAFGAGPAVLAGDALLAHGFAALTASGAGRACRGAAADMLSTALVELADGQAEDIAFEDRPWTGRRAVSVEEYTTMAAGKTGALLGCAAGLGALLGGGGPEATAAMTLAGRNLGLGFQAIDDLLGIWGDPLVTGKPVFSDLRRRKKTLPVVHAFVADGAAHARRLTALLDGAGDAPDREGTLRRAAELIARAGGRSFTEDRAGEHLRQAQRSIDAVAVNRAAAAELTELSRFVADRAH